MCQCLRIFFFFAKNLIEFLWEIVFKAILQQQKRKARYE